MTKIIAKCIVAVFAALGVYLTFALFEAIFGRPADVYAVLAGIITWIIAHTTCKRGDYIEME